MVDPIVEEQLLHSGEINDKTQYIVDIDEYLSHEENETESSNNVVNQFSECYVIGKEFDDADIAYNFYNEYGLSRGFGIRKHYHNKHSGTKEIYRHVFVCNKEGFKCIRRTTGNVKPRRIRRTGCKAMIQVTLSKEGKWVVDKFHDEHNHPLDDPLKVPRHWSHKVFRCSKECKDLVKVMSQEGIGSSAITKIVNAYKGSQEDKVTRYERTDTVSEERKFNLGKECRGIIIHFQEKAKVDKDFYFAIDLNTDGTFKSVFWADGRSRSSYNQFGDVVVFDVTYKANTCSLPFASFVGVNHHGQTILFGAALLDNVTEVTFTWLFKNFLECMYDCPPMSIITDEDMAKCKAIQKVFPNTRHRFCAYHIRKHALEQLQPLRSRFVDFQDTYNNWVKSQNISVFEAGWVVLKEKYDIDDDTWLAKMYKLRHYWVKAYLKDTFFAGMTTSGRSESIHSFFGDYVNSETMLNDFVLQYDKAVSSRTRAEEDEDFRTLNSQPTLHSDHPIEVMAAKCYTRNIYEIFKKEWKASVNCGHEKISKDAEVVKYRVGYLAGNKEGWKTVEYNVVSPFFASCLCARFETSGVLCKHILYIMRRKLLMSIPNHYISPRWTMKATVGSIGKRRKGVNCDASNEVSFVTLWSIRAKFNKVMENGRDSLSEIEKLNAFFDGFLEEQYRRKNNQAEMISESNSTVRIAKQFDMSQQILVSDPINCVNTKGCLNTKQKSSIDLSMDEKKNIRCGYCREEGHDTTGCQQGKMDELQDGNTTVKSQVLGDQ